MKGGYFKSDHRSPLLPRQHPVDRMDFTAFNRTLYIALALAAFGWLDPFPFPSPSPSLLYFPG
jgi:hypothetical protein